MTVYDQHKGTFEFHPGPIFHTIVLADEINRASPKTQSALLEVMEEGRVTVDGIAAPGRPAVPRDRDPEPHRAGRHLPAARGPARPVPDEDVRRLPRPGRHGRAAGQRQGPRPRGPGHAGHHLGHDRPDERPGRRRVRRPGGPHLRRRARRGVAPPAPRTTRALGRAAAWRWSACEVVGGRRRPRLRHPRRRQGARRARALPPPAARRRGAVQRGHRSRPSSPGCSTTSRRQPTGWPEQP